ncbi:BOB2 [Symbiodinium pilosum]|uniref:BOB2 protein n=1 Tax=Symbiodinium pilosum TaxID=2952 RepID=A0A812WSN0_SYMPI|nr:BOB2 [Symbiodinium pilosum]
MSRLPRSGPFNSVTARKYAASQVADALHLQMQGPKVPLPPISQGSLSLREPVRTARQATATATATAEPILHSKPQAKRSNGAAGLLSMLAIAMATLVTRWFQPSKRSLSRMNRARMARRFLSYQWEEAGKDGREIRLYVPVDETVKEKHVEIELTESKLRVGLKLRGQVIDSDLYDMVNPHESHWFIDQHEGRRCVAVTLMKKNMWKRWDFLTSSEAACLRVLGCVKTLLAFGCLVMFVQKQLLVRAI